MNGIIKTIFDFLYIYLGDFSIYIMPIIASLLFSIGFFLIMRYGYNGSRVIQADQEGEQGQELVFIMAESFLLLVLICLWFVFLNY